MGRNYSLVMDEKDVRPIIDVTVNRINMKGLLDTGANSVILYGSKDVLSELGLVKLEYDTRVAGINDTDPVWLPTYKGTLHIGPVSFIDIEFAYIEAERKYDVIVPATLLQSCDYTISNSKSVVSFRWESDRILFKSVTEPTTGVIKQILESKQEEYKQTALENLQEVERMLNEEE